MSQYVGGKEASNILGVHQRTLYNWEVSGKIETIRSPGGKRLYNVEKFLENVKNIEDNKKYEGIERLKIIYTRVSSKSQEDDLERQQKYLKKKFPKHLLIEDIGSGMNLNKRGIRKIIKFAIEGKIEEVVVAYKDRLARFGFELIEDLIKEYSNGKIIILNQEEDIEPEEELVKDVMSILNVYVAKMNGLRKYNVINKPIKN